MLKKAGIVVATATAGLLAVAPLAFAADKNDSDRGGDGRASSSPSFNYFGIDTEEDGAACDIGAYVGADTAQNSDSFVFALLGAATGALTQTAAPVTTATQTLAPAASCNDLTFEDNSEDNDMTFTDLPG